MHLFSSRLCSDQCCLGSKTSCGIPQYVFEKMSHQCYLLNLKQQSSLKLTLKFCFTEFWFVLLYQRSLEILETLKLCLEEPSPRVDEKNSDSVWISSYVLMPTKSQGFFSWIQDLIKLVLAWGKINASYEDAIRFCPYMKRLLYLFLPMRSFYIAAKYTTTYNH